MVFSGGPITRNFIRFLMLCYRQDWQAGEMKHERERL
jgi:hypothetical protein